MASEKRQKHHRKVLQRRSTEETEKVLSVRLLHDNAPAHTSAIVTAFLKKEKVTVLPHPQYSPDLAPCDFFLFPKLKAFLAEIPVLTGTWICHSSVPYYCAQISVP